MNDTNNGWPDKSRVTLNRAEFLHKQKHAVMQKRIAELEAALATARRDGMEEAAKIAVDYETVAYQHGNLPISDPNECAAQAAREIATSIRAALGKEK